MLLCYGRLLVTHSCFVVSFKFSSLFISILINNTPPSYAAQPATGELASAASAASITTVTSESDEEDCIITKLSSLKPKLAD